MFIGMDFGSTNSTISIWDKDRAMPRALNLVQSGSPNIPSVVSKNKRKKTYEYGTSAKNKSGYSSDRVFKGFKMMLPETDEKVLSDRGYELPTENDTTLERDTPHNITRRFLSNYLCKAIKDVNDGDRIEKLVVGIPVNWDQMDEKHQNLLEGRRILRDICKNLQLGEYGKCINEVQIVSEPAAASAYFAYSFRQKNEEDFEGRILLVDYGGGTLDLTLTDVRTKQDKNGREVMEIEVGERTGAGEVSEGKIGRAAIVYMENVVAEAIERAGLPPVTDFADPKFQYAVNNFEIDLQTKSVDVEEFYKDYGIRDLEQIVDESDNEFMYFEFGGEEVIITYSLMVDVYNRLIYDVLEENLNEMISYLNGDTNVKIALVGGFGNFYLVKKQIDDKFSISYNDHRMQDIIATREEREQAISLGAALLAADIVLIKDTAPYSIGVNYERSAGEKTYYSINYRQEIIADQPYYAKDDHGDMLKFMIFDGRIEKLLYNKSTTEKNRCELIPKEIFREKIKNTIRKDVMIAAIGFSLDRSNVLSIHFLEFDSETDSFVKESKPMELAQLTKLFDVQLV